MQPFSWLPSPAPLWFADFAGGHYWFAEHAYPTFAAWLAATNGTFTRASTKVYTDADGYQRTAAIDEPAFGPLGLLLSGAVGPQAADILKGGVFTGFDTTKGTQLASYAIDAHIPGVSQTILRFHTAAQSNDFIRLNVSHTDQESRHMVANFSPFTVNYVPSASPVPGTLNTHIGRWATDDFQAAYNGVLGTPDISGVVPGGTDTWAIGLNPTDGSEPLFGSVARVAYWATPLSDADLVRLSGVASTTTRTEAAVAALAGLLSGLALPEVRRAEQLPGKFEPDDSGAGRYLNVRKGSTVRNALLSTGDGPGTRVYELDHDAEVEWLVEHIDRAVRSATFEAGLQSIDDALQADPTLGGVVSYAEADGVQFGGLTTEGIAEIEACILTVRLTFTSDRPF